MTCQVFGGAFECVVMLFLGRQTDRQIDRYLKYKNINSDHKNEGRKRGQDRNGWGKQPAALEM